MLRVRWQELEPHFAARVRARLYNTVPPPDRLSPAWLALVWVVSLLLLVAYVGICFCLAGPVALVGVSVMPVALLGLALGPAYLSARRNPDRPRHVLPARIPRDLLDESLRAVAETPTELLYAEILILLQREEARRGKNLPRLDGRAVRAQCAAFVAEAGRATRNPHAPRQQAVLRELDGIRTALLRRNPDVSAVDIFTSARQSGVETVPAVVLKNNAADEMARLPNTIGS